MDPATIIGEDGNAKQATCLTLVSSTDEEETFLGLLYAGLSPEIPEWLIEGLIDQNNERAQVGASHDCRGNKIRKGKGR